MLKEVSEPLQCWSWTLYRRKRTSSLQIQSRAPVQPDDDEERTMEEENNLLVNQAIYSSSRDSEMAREDDKNCRKMTFVSRSCVTAEMGGQRLAQVRATSSWTGQRGTTPVSRTISSMAPDSSFLRSWDPKFYRVYIAQGIIKCHTLAEENVLWPGLSKQIGSMVKCCQICIQEPLILPGQKANWLVLGF